MIACYLIERFRRFLKQKLRSKPTSQTSQTEENQNQENIPITDEIIDRMIDRAAEMGKEFWVKIEERERAKKREQPEGDLLA